MTEKELQRLRDWRDDSGPIPVPEEPIFVPKQIGPYRVERELGSGGMGVVYLAWRSDQHFRKQVAIKLLHGSQLSEQMLKRFRFERQVLANLEHPNIARLLDGGTTEQGEPYLVMEYVRGGVPLDRYCDEQSLGLQERLQLFRAVCSAVQYAHQHLVVHRDLKPTNILVTPEGDVKLLDFGIAKSLFPVFGEEMAKTQTGAHAMTPEYASPEQIRGDAIGVASDVYSLGVVLYQLITGSLPFRTREGGMGELMREVCENEPRKPSTAVAATRILPSRTAIADSERGIIEIEGRDRLARKLTGDIDNIILMAMRKEPLRRYASVEHLGEDIRRFLEGLTVTARPSTARYRAVKFVRRNTGAVAAAALILATLVGGIVATSRQARRAGEQRGIAQAQAAEAQKQRQLAEQMAALARENQAKAESKAQEAQAQAAEAHKQQALADRRFGDIRSITSDFLFYFDSQISRLPGATPVRKQVVAKAKEYLELLAKEKSADPMLGRELSLSYVQLGYIQRSRNSPNLGDTAGARKSFLKALEIINAARREGHELPTIAEVEMGAYLGLGDMQAIDGDMKGALGFYLTGEKVSARIALSINPKQGYDSRRAPLRAYGKVAETLMAMGDKEGARRRFEQSTALTEKLLKEKPEDLLHLRDRMVSLNMLGAFLRKNNEFSKALPVFEESTRIAETAMRKGAESGRANQYQRDYMVSLAMLGLIWKDLSAPEKSAEYHRKQLAVANSNLALDPKDLMAHYDVASANTQLSEALIELNRREEALSFAKAAVLAAEGAAKIDSRSVPTLHHRTMSHHALAEVFTAMADWKSAEAEHNEILRITAEMAGPKATEQPVREYGNRLLQAGDFHLLASKSGDRSHHLNRAQQVFVEAVEVFTRIGEEEQKTNVNRRLAELAQILP